MACGTRPPAIRNLISVGCFGQTVPGPVGGPFTFIDDHSRPFTITKPSAYDTDSTGVLRLIRFISPFSTDPGPTS